MGVAYIAYSALEPWTNTQQFNLPAMQTYTHSDYFFPMIGMVYKYKQIPPSHINTSTEFVFWETLSKAYSARPRLFLPPSLIVSHFNMRAGVKERACLERWEEGGHEPPEGEGSKV